MVNNAMRKPDFCIGENKGADQLCSNCTADHRLCFRFFTDIKYLKLLATFCDFVVTVQISLCQTWSETSKTGSLASRLVW